MLIFLMFIILVAVLILMIVILKKLQTIEIYLIGDSLSINSEFKKLSKLYEILPALEPLRYFPWNLQFIASKLSDMISFVDSNLKDTEKKLAKKTLSEMEKFAKSGSLSKPFPASDSLKKTLREWAGYRHDGGRINKWREQYGQTFVDVISGKVTIEQAEKSLDNIPYFSWDNRDEARVSEIYNKETEKWQAGKWFELFEELKAKREEEIERNKPWE